MATDLGGAQITSLLEALPGIAQVLRSPVADAFVSLIRQAARHQDFQLADAEEVLRFSVRRNLMSQDEGDRILGELREGIQRRADRAADRAEARKPAPPRVVPKPKPKVVAKATPTVAKPKVVAKATPTVAKPTVAKPKVTKTVKPAKPAKTNRPAKPAARSSSKPVAKKKVPARKR